MIEFDYAFATDTPGGPKISMMVATGSIHGSIFAVVAMRKGGQDDCVMHSFQKKFDRLGLVKAELKCDQEPSTLDVAHALIKRCQSTALIVTATPKGSKGSLGRGQRSNLIIQGRRLNEIQDRSWTRSCVDGLDGTTLCMGCKQLSSERTWEKRTWENALSFYPEQGPRWRSCAIWRGVLGAKPFWGWGQVEHEVDARSFFFCKLDRTDEFLLLTPTGAMKIRCVRRLEGDGAWDLQLLKLCVGSPWNATARSTQQQPPIQQKDELESGRRAKRVYLRQNNLDKYGRTAGCPGCVGNGQHTEECRARMEQEMVDKGDAIKLETSGNQEEIVKGPDVSLNKRKIGEPDINPGGVSS